MSKFLDKTGLDTLWAKIKSTFVKDVKIDGTSVVSSGTASIPMASSSTKGVVKVDAAMSSSSTNPVQNKVVQTALDGKIPFGYKILDTNPFGGKHLYLNYIGNAMYSIDKRYFVTVTRHYKVVDGVEYPRIKPNASITDDVYYEDSPVVSTVDANMVRALFNCNYESQVIVAPGQYLKVHIQFSNEANWTPATGRASDYSYNYGDYFLSFYYSNIPDSAVWRCYNTYTQHTVGWKQGNFSYFAGNASSTASIILTARDAMNNKRTCIEFVIFPKSDVNAGLTQIDWCLDRPNLSTTFPFFTNFADQNSYVDWYFKQKVNSTATIEIKGSDGSIKAKSLTLTETPLPVSSGGTGATTARGAMYNTLGQEITLDSTLDDNRLVPIRNNEVSAANGVFRWFKLSNVWTWIKAKLTSDTGVDISGNAATATTAAGYTNDGAIATALSGKATPADITSAIESLDVSSVGGAGKYISAISEADGKISATATTMDTTPTANSTNAVTSGGIKTALDGKAPSSHSHGNIANDGKSTSEPTSTTKFLRADGTWAAPSSVAYEHTNEINTRNVPSSGNKMNHWFNYRDGDTDAASPNNLITDYYFGNRNNSVEGVKLNADGIISPTRNNAGRMHFCIKLTRLNTTENDFATVRVPFSSQNSEENFGYVDIIIKFRTSSWNARAFVFARGAYSKLGQAFYLEGNPNAVGGVCYLGIDITDANVYIRFSPIIICHGSSAGYEGSKAMKIEFGDFTPSGSPSPLQTRWPAFIDYNNNSHSAVGSSARPVYVDANGTVQACTYAISTSTTGTDTNTIYLV